MQFEWITDEGIKTVALVGICKNAGKTTLLNHLLASWPRFRYGVFSTGIDGEESDSVFKHPKPAVSLIPGTVFCCDTPTLESLGGRVTILEQLACSPVLRSLWLAETSDAARTRITGPAALLDQVFTLGRMMEYGVQKVLIDGSLDRKSIALSDAVDAVAVVIGASFGSVSNISAELRRLLILNEIPVHEPDAPAAYQSMISSEQILVFKDGQWLPTGIVSLLGSEDLPRRLHDRSPEAIYIPGAVTDAVLPKLQPQLKNLGSRVILRHPDCLKLSLHKLESFIRDFSPETLIPFKIKGFALNPQGFGAAPGDAIEFRARLRLNFPGLELPDIRELSA